MIDYLNHYGEYCLPTPDYLNTPRVPRYIGSDWISMSSGEMDMDYVKSSAEAIAEVNLEVLIRKIFLDKSNGQRR